MEGQYPADMASLTVAGKYLSSVPNSKAPNYHGDTSLVTAAVGATDSMGWVYNNTPTDANLGTVWVNCTHTDTKGTTWTSY